MTKGLYAECILTHSEKTDTLVRDILKLNQDGPVLQRDMYYLRQQFMTSNRLLNQITTFSDEILHLLIIAMLAMTIVTTYFACLSPHPR